APLTAAATKCLLPGGKWTIEPDRDAGDADGHCRQVCPDESRPSPREKPAEREKRQVGKMHDNEGVGQPYPHGSSAFVSGAAGQQPVSPLRCRRRRRLRCIHEVGEESSELVRAFALRKVSGALEDLESAS